VYEFAPQSGFVESLLIRHLLDYEETEFSPFLETPDELTLDTKYLAEFEDFVIDAAKQQAVRRPALWYLAAGYLRFMRAFADNGYPEAAKLLRQAEDTAEQDSQIFHQARLLRHVVKLYQQKRIRSSFNDSLYPELQWLADRGETVIFQSVMTALGQKFLLQGELPYAVCCFYAANHNILWPEARLEHKQSAANLVLDMYADDKGVEALHAFMTQRSYTAFESFLLRYLPLTQEEVLDVWGTHLLRQGRFKQALQVFERIEPLYWERENFCGESWQAGSFCAKQFRTSFFDNTQQRPGRFVRTNKAEFIRQIVSLEQQARRDRAQAGEYYRQIANAFYNSSYWGYTGVLWNGSLIWSFDYEYGADFRYYYAQRDPAQKNFVKFPFNRPDLKQSVLRREKVFRQTYGTRDFALKYYQQALKAARDDELAAELLAMSQKCVDEPAMTSISSPDFVPENADYFRKLHEDYSHTTFYEELLAECPQFKAYLRENF
jgi:tetratricopeptide (TPR) repeat protein